ncbi:HSP20-like chaperone [Naematelia encephala]|uniref:HSP20-like chaperone n=1 Tax=Naematelia encephala TaxID=71784 RepID=A0A1Y2AJF3_9TREE|nr:HSP20-like chaperone [Naematelia encephala]
MAPIHPEIQYAERSSATDPEKNIIYFTINAPDIKGEPKLEIKPTEIIFAATAGDPSKGVPEKEYKFDLQLYEEIIPEETRKITTSRAIILVLRKKELKAEYWLRLTKEKPNRNWIKTDFSKWVDEDEQDGVAPE